MPVPFRHVTWLGTLIVVIAASGGAQSSNTGSLTIADSLFQPIRLPSELSFGYPPNEIHKPRIVDMIRRREFDALDAMYDALRADVARDVKHEMRFGDAFAAVQRNDSALLASIDAWIAARPRSAHARVARASYLFDAAWRRRGTAYIADTPEENIRGMAELAQRAILDVVAAIRIDSTHLVAYEVAIGVTKLAGSHELAAQLMTRGFAMNRGSFALPRAFMSMLWPRWGGSEAAMIAFGEQVARDSAINPRLATLRGAVYESRANDSSLARNDAGAVRELNKAVAFGPERIYVRERGKAYFRLGAYEYAFADLRFALIERSQDREVLEYYGRTLVELATRSREAVRPTIVARAIEVLTLAAYLDPSNTRVRNALARARQMAES